MTSGGIPYRKVAILGTGLMGGSLAGALKSLPGPPQVFGTTKDPADRDLAKKLGWVDTFFERNIDAASQAELVVLAVPPCGVAEIWEELGGRLSPGTLVTDLSSVKGSLYELHRARYSALLPAYVSSHPMAGSERAGVKSARPDLFSGKTVFLSPFGEESGAVQALSTFWQALGARNVPIVAPRDHDGIVAHISHLPHVLAYSLLHLACEVQKKNLYAGFDWQSQKGGSFSDLLRIARSSPSLWADILHQNRTAVLEAIDAYFLEVGRLREAIETMNQAELADLLQAWTTSLAEGDHRPVSREA
jgi:prephenate dehydrogenase